MITTIELNNDNFKEILSSTKNLVVDVKTSWCGPCKTLSPIIDELSGEYDGVVTIGKLDADECRDIVTEIGIRNIPTVLFYKDGEIVDRFTGMKPKSQIVELIEKNYLLEA